MSLNLDWQLNKDRSGFTRESILACAPPSSGVYGLFNCARTVFIGESGNIRDALLIHESEVELRKFQPMAFTFELCAPELRKVWAAELITTFHPLVESQSALSELSWFSDQPQANDPDQTAWELGTYTDHQEATVHESKEVPNRKTFQVKRILAMASVPVFVATAAVSFYFRRPAQNVVHGKISVSPPRDVRLRESGTHLTDTAGEPTKQNPGTISATEPTSPRRNNTAQLPAYSGAKKGVVQPTMGSDTGTTMKAQKEWSVQISAAPTREIADGLVQEVKAKGYDGYIEQATVKGQNYYRVRIGRFNTQEEAESTRRSLTRQEGYPNAYLAFD